MEFGIAETGIARGSPPGTTTEVLRFGVPFAEIRVVSVAASAVCGLVMGSARATRRRGPGAVGIRARGRRGTGSRDAWPKEEEKKERKERKRRERKRGNKEKVKRK
jgi:hypothetical protein